MNFLNKIMLLPLLLLFVQHNCMSQSDSPKYHVGFNHLNENFFNKIPNRNYSSYEFARLRDSNVTILRWNHNNWITKKGDQLEIEYYPTFKKGYGYFSFGYSKTELFPKAVINSEVFKPLPRNFEGSLGTRLSYARDNTFLIMYTGTLAKYIGNWWIQLRPSIINVNKTNIKNISLVSRYYIEGKYDYLELSLIKGIDIQQPTALLQSAVNVFMYKAAIKKSITNKVKANLAISHLYQHINKKYYHNLGIEVGTKILF